MTNDITQYQGGQVPTNPADMEDYFKAYAQAYAEAERAGGSSVRIQNFTMMIGDQPLPGNQFAGIILDAVRLNAYYPRPYNPQNVEPPTCYAIGRSDAEMRPHPDMQKDLNFFQPQANQCQGCPLNEFGSSPTGSGKACSNKRKLLILPAGYYEAGQNGLVLNPITDLEHYNTSPFINMTISPTALQGWGQWVRQSAAQYQRPMFGLIARIYIYPHPKHGKECVGFETLAPIPNEWGPTIAMRHNQALDEITQGFEPPEAPQQRGGGFYNAQQAQQVQQQPQGFAQEAAQSQQGFAQPQQPQQPTDAPPANPFAQG